MKKILVTGGAGYIGSHTVVELLNNPQYEVIILDNFSNSNSEIINRLYDITNRPIKLYQTDCRDNLDDIFTQNKIDGIIHFAALKSVPESVEKPVEYYDNNLNSLLNILKTASRFQTRNIVFSSSCSVYGNLETLPATEDSPLSKAESPYANTKLIGEQILKDFTKVNPSFKTLSLRYFNPVGAHYSGLIGELPINKPSNILPVICDSAETGKEFTVFGNNYKTKDGTCVRDYVHVSDIARAHVLSMDYLISDKNETSYDVINLGSGNGYTVLELIKAFEKTNKIKLNYKIGDTRPGDIVEIYADNTKAKKIGWIPELKIQDMVYSAWKWHKNKI